MIDEGPDLTLPDISEEEERIVDQWWEEFRPYFRERDAEEMLRRIRKEHPEAYVHSFEYYDNDVIGELALTGRRNEIPEYFSFFKQYPGSDSGKLSEITDLLAAAGLDKELFELSHAVETPIWQSPQMGRSPGTSPSAAAASTSCHFMMILHGAFAAFSQTGKTCMRLFELCRKAVDSTDFGPRLYAAFPDTAIPAALERPACP